MKIDYENIWRSKNLQSTILLPLSWIFRAAVILRKSYYRIRNYSGLDLDTFVIVVGNLTVGGTGKTPFVIWLANYCKNKGLNVGIVTRGYKRECKQHMIEVQPQNTPSEVGDEAILLTLKTSCPVMVSVDRKEAVKALVDKHRVEVVLSDDGLQHYNLPRDIEIVIIDAEKRFGNGRCLPAGPLREPIKRLNSCDLVVYSNCKESSDASFEVKMGNVVSLSANTSDKSLDDFVGNTVHAVAGIGNPDRFFNMLRKAGIHLIEHKFPDHYAYQESDLEFDDENPILMTEKDAVKCKKFINKDMWYVPISLMPNDMLKQRITTIIEGIPHG